MGIPPPPCGQPTDPTPNGGISFTSSSPNTQGVGKACGDVHQCGSDQAANRRPQPQFHGISSQPTQALSIFCTVISDFQIGNPGQEHRVASCSLVLPATPPGRSVAGPGKARCQPPAHARSQSRTLPYLLADSPGSFSALIARTPVRECKHPVRHRPARETVSLDGGFLVRFRHFAFVERECFVLAAAFTLENVGWHPYSNSLVSCRNTAPKVVGVSRWKVGLLRDALFAHHPQ